MFYGLGSDLKIIIFVPLDPNPESVLNFGFGSREAIEYGSGFGSTSLLITSVSDPGILTKSDLDTDLECEEKRAFFQIQHTFF